MPYDSPNCARIHVSSSLSLRQSATKTRATASSPRHSPRATAQPTSATGALDRVADQGIRATGNEFVTFLQGDGLAPVFSQVTTRPDRKEQTACGNCRAAPETPSTVWKESLV